MKKKISLVVAVLVLVLGLAGCGNAKTVSYDKDTLIQSCDAVFDIIESGSITSDQITEMSDWNQGYLMAQFESQTGVQMEADTFATALEGWKASLEECGDYESHKDYEFEASSTGVTVTAPATFSDRSADLEFVFDENMTLESFTVNAHYGMSEILEKAGLNTLLGMGTVFVMLIFMSFIISLIKYVPALLNGTSKKKKEEGLIRHFGFSFHGTPELLDKILSEHPEVEIVQIQMNYADWENPLVQSGRLYEVLRRYNMPFLVMEPVKGGSLASASPEVEAEMKKIIPDASVASWALRFAASLPGVATVLSGMSNEEQMNDNLKTFTNFEPLSEEERKVIEKAQDELKKNPTVPCTSCRYCCDGCPQQISIPDVFRALNTIRVYGEKDRAQSYYEKLTQTSGKAGDCIQCGQCESVCPQHLSIISLLEEASEKLDK